MSQFIVVPKGASAFLLKEAHNFLNLTNISQITEYHVFEFEGGDGAIVAEELFDTYELVDTLEAYDTPESFRYRQVLGQYDEVSEMTNRFVSNIYGYDMTLHHSNIVRLEGASEADMAVFKDYFINETESELVDFGALSYDMGVSSGKDLRQVEGFIDFDESQLAKLLEEYSMDMSDIRVVQEYFREEGVDPTIFQLKMIDTYWSDHCRHTTFLTELSQIEVEDGHYKEAILTALEEYNAVRSEVYGEREKKVSLMDMATINAKYAKKLGLLTNVDESDEVNACCINIKVDVDGEEEDYLLYFKNETHNHPTEIEPFGGAATCIGGGIRDPLSGRSYVHQALRITGAADPTKAYDETLPNKLPQRVITQRAAEGYSDYGNQIGQSAGFVQEFYHPGFEAKRMELGALVAAAPKSYVIRKDSEPGDKIILLGGRTGRDGLGAAVGSSKVQTDKSMELQGAEVQKGNPAIERKIIRLFRQSEATRLIKKCNDFGAGGVSVAIGELADGLTIELDKVPQKYAGMDPSEIALSESQERMAVVLDAQDVDAFVALAEAEDLEASIVAEVTDSPYMVMTYEGEEVLRLKRAFLDSNGGAKETIANIQASSIAAHYEKDRSIEQQLTDIRYTSQSALGQNFDFSIGKGTVLAPFGGASRLTTQEGMVAKIPTLGHETETVSVMAGSFLPDVASDSPFHGAYYAVLNSVAKAVALGVPYQEARLTMQEFFESTETPEKWGKPAGALLGAFKAMKQLGLGAIGGKDSMSGTYEDLTVPPSVISFAVAATKVDAVNSRELKATDSKVILLEVERLADDTFDEADMKAMFEQVTALIEAGQVRAISTLNEKTVELNLVEMALGNHIAFEMEPEFIGHKGALGFLIEVASDTDLEGAIVVAKTCEGSQVQIDQAYDLADLADVYTKPLADVFTEIEFQAVQEVKAPLAPAEGFTSDVKVLIPVMNGVNGEYDLYESFKQYTPNVDFFIIKEELAYQASIDELKARLADYDILAFPDGSILSNRMHYGQAIARVIQDMQAEIEAFIQDKYVLAIGASMAGFVRSGLIEFGKVQAGTHLTYRENPYGKFISAIVPANVHQTTAFAEEGSYTTALASYTLTLEADMAKVGEQVLSTYAHYFEDVQAIDAMTDPSGYILGVNANFERFGQGLLKNIETHEAPFVGNIVRLAEGN